MATMQESEVGLLIYPGAQMSAILSMTDLFLVSNRFSSPHTPSGPNRITVSHWCIEAEGSLPQRVHEIGSSTRAEPDVLILPPSASGCDGDLFAVGWIAD